MSDYEPTTITLWDSDEGGLTGLVEETNDGHASDTTPRPSKRREWIETKT